MIGKAEDPIIRRSIGRKQTKIVYTKDGSDKRTKTLLTPDVDAAKPCFTDEGEVFRLLVYCDINANTWKTLTGSFWYCRCKNSS
jgi:hypothetical protein